MICQDNSSRVQEVAKNNTSRKKEALRLSENGTSQNEEVLWHIEPCFSDLRSVSAISFCKKMVATVLTLALSQNARYIGDPI